MVAAVVRFVSYYITAGEVATHYSPAKNGRYPPTQNGDIRSLF